MDQARDWVAKQHPPYEHHHRNEREWNPSGGRPLRAVKLGCLAHVGLTRTWLIQKSSAALRQLTPH